jgi:hypothetical protein
MNQLTKKLGLILILVTVLTFLVSKITIAYTTQTTNFDDVLTFLDDVVELDLSKYEVKLVGTIVNDATELEGITQITGKYSLESNTSKLSVLFKFRNNTLSWCLLKTLEGLPCYKAQSSPNLQDNIKNFLQRYQSFTGDSELETMKNILETVDPTKNTTKTVNNIKISTSTNMEATSFTWERTVNGADYAGMRISFSNGSFCSLSDKRNIYTIGNTDVNISKEEAIILSHKYVENLTWTIGNEKVTNFNIVEEGTNPELLTRTRYDTLKLYPYWYVLLYLDDLYPGNVRHIQVMFWADTGELIDCQPLSFGGASSKELVNIETLNEPEQTLPLSSQHNDEPFLSTYMFIIALLIITILAITITVVLYRNKYK